MCLTFKKWHGEIPLHSMKIISSIESGGRSSRHFPVIEFEVIFKYFSWLFLAKSCERSLSHELVQEPKQNFIILEQLEVRESIPDEDMFRDDTSTDCKFGHNLPTIVNVLWLKRCEGREKSTWFKKRPQRNKTLRSVGVSTNFFLLICVKPQFVWDKSRCRKARHDCWLTARHRLHTEKKPEII